MIRVAIADDDATVRRALWDVLAEDTRFVVVGAVASGSELEQLVDEEGPDVVLLDVRMPGGGPAGVEAVLSRPGYVAEGGRRTGAPLVIAVSAQTGVSTVVAMLRAGAVSYFSKGRLGSLPDMVARCVGGEVVLAVPSGSEALQQLMLAPES